MNKRCILQRYCRLLCFLFISMLSVNLNARPQDDVRITLNLDNTALEKVLEIIEEQSPYLFFNKGVDFSQTISVSVTDETIENTCKALFTPIMVSYKIQGTYIYISKAEPVTVSGTVRDAAGVPVPGAAVMETGTSNGTMTDLDGNYSLTVTGGAVPWR